MAKNIPPQKAINVVDFLDQVQKNGPIYFDFKPDRFKESYGLVVDWFRTRTNSCACLSEAQAKSFAADISRVVNRTLEDSIEFQDAQEGILGLKEYGTPGWTQMIYETEPHAVLNAINGARFECADCLNAKCSHRDSGCPVEDVIAKSKKA